MISVSAPNRFYIKIKKLLLLLCEDCENSESQKLFVGTQRASRHDSVVQVCLVK